MLNSVVLAMRSISSISWLISSWILRRSSRVLESFAASRARSCIFSRIASASFRPPSAVCTREMASSAFFWATLKPRICTAILVAIARPAASSAARLILRPEDSRSMDLPMAKLVCPRFLHASNALMLWFIRTVSTSFFLEIYLVNNPSLQT